MSWNHRVIKHADGFCEIVEMYYEADGKPSGYCAARIGFDEHEDPFEQISRFSGALYKPWINVDKDGMII